MGFECQIVSDTAELEGLATVWQRLWQAQPQPEIFQSFPWTRAWWQSYRHGLKMCVSIVYQAGEIVLILPLVQRHGTLRFLGAPQSDYCDMLCSHAQPVQPLSAALQALLRAAPMWRECVFENLRRDSRLLQAYGQLPRQLRHLLRLQVADTCPTILFGDNRRQVIESLLASKHLRRRLHRLQKSGEVVFRHVERREEVQQQLTQFFRCHRRRCALLAKTSCFEEPEMRSLMRTLAAQLDPCKELRFGVLELDGRPLAWSLGFQLQGKYAYYQQTFDVDAEEYAPGEILLYHLFSYAREAVEREVDFLRGDEFFKRRFATHTHQILSLHFERPGFNGWLRRVGSLLDSRWAGARRRIVSYVRTHPTAFHIFRSLWVLKRTQARRVRWARATGQLNSYLLAWGFDLFHHAVWNRQTATLFQSKPGQLPFQLECAASDPDITVAQGRFSDLADLTLEHPEVPFPRFHEYRDRLKHGDRVYVVRRHGDLALVAWVRTRRDLSLRSAADEREAVTMYECWPVSDPGPGCTCLLSMLATEALKGRTDLLICCPDLPSPSRVALDRQGYVPKLRIVIHRFLRWFGHRSTQDEPRAIPELLSADDYVCPKLRKRSKP